jgi:hypothetical protein
MKQVWTPNHYPKINDIPPDTLKMNILRFSWWYGCIINPEKNLDNYVVRVKSTGHCACHDERFTCPCYEAPGEIFKSGYCTCRLFVGPEYLKTILARIQKKVRANPDYRPDK